MIKNILNIRYDIEGRNMEINETIEKQKSISDYFTNPELKASEQSKEKAVADEKKWEDNLNKVISSMWKLIHSDEMKQLETSIWELTKQEYKELSKWVHEHVVPEINNFKETLEEKGVFEKINAFKEEAKKVIKELLDKAKELKENNEKPEDARKLKLQAALLKQAQAPQDKEIK